MRYDATQYRPYAHGLLRIVAGFMFWQHGAQKLFGWLGGFGGTPGATADIASLMGVAGLIEFFGGILIALGLFTRPAALIAAGEMAVAYFMAHLPNGFWPILNGGELAALFSWLFLFFAIAGGGAFALDNLRTRRTVQAPDAESGSDDEPPAIPGGSGAVPV